MYCLRVSNVNKALPLGLRWLTGYNGDREESRNGDVLVSKMPVCTIYDDTTHRVLFSPVRNANPFFHLFEALWMLAGRNDLATITQFNKQMSAYSDDGGLTQPGAYGFRWREYFGYDQVTVIIDELRRNPSSRRCVLGMWSPGGERDNSILIGMGDLLDAVRGSSDVPCNTHAYFRVHDGVLDMSVQCRSNDIYWGAYGANVVHFSMLLEYMAIAIGVQPGKLYQYSWNYHFYPEVVGDAARMQELILDCEKTDYYSARVLRPMKLMQDQSIFDIEVRQFVDDMHPDKPIVVRNYTEPFIGFVALPMLRSWQAYKAGEYWEAEDWSRKVRAEDWRIAASGWMERKAQARREKEAGL